MAANNIAEVNKRASADREKQLLKCFGLFDLDGTGLLNAQELDKLAKIKRKIERQGTWDDEKNMKLFRKVSHDLVFILFVVHDAGVVVNTFP